MRRRWLLAGLFVIFFIGGIPRAVFSQEWKEVKGKHFIIQYPVSVGTSWARRVLSASERYYDKIASQIGYARYQNFWTWNERVKVLIYPDKATFSQETGQPAWSRGGAGRDAGLTHSRHIVTYKQEEGFLDGVLPHEISHLIIRDFIGSTRAVPLWLDEGLAQLYDGSKRAIARQIMREAVRQGRYLSFTTLLTQDIRTEHDETKVRIFYAQSISVIDFLIQSYGNNKFGQFCRYLKNGKTLEEALRATYTSFINSIADLEKRWVEYMQ